MPGRPAVSTRFLLTATTTWVLEEGGREGARSLRGYLWCRAAFKMHAVVYIRGVRMTFDMSSAQAVWGGWPVLGQRSPVSETRAVGLCVPFHNPAPLDKKKRLSSKI